MKSIPLFLILFLVVTLFYQCSPDNDEDIRCFEFDQRQCAGDDWADLVPLIESKAVREEKMQAYLATRDIEVEEIRLVIEFHESVCEACDICPEQDRFFIKIDQQDEAALAKLDLLNYGQVECGEVF